MQETCRDYAAMLSIRPTIYAIAKKYSEIMSAVTIIFKQNIITHVRITDFTRGPIFARPLIFVADILFYLSQAITIRRTVGR